MVLDGVPVEYQFPNVKHEIIEELFLIDEEEEEAETNGRVAYSTSLLDLEDEALKITRIGNQEKKMLQTPEKRYAQKEEYVFGTRKSITGKV